MSAPNFNCSHNSRHLYAFCCFDCDYEAYKKDLKENDPDYYEENEDYLENSEFAVSDWYDEEKDYYLNWLEEKLNETAKNSGLKVDFIDLAKNRVYDGTELCTVSKTITFAGIGFDLELSIDFEAGYYEGFKLDWNIKNLAGYECDGLDDLSDQDLIDALTGDTYYGYYYRDGLKSGLAKMLAPKFRKRLEKELKAMIDVIDNSLEAICPCCVEGHCLSNGEGIYWRIDKEKAVA